MRNSEINDQLNAFDWVTLHHVLNGKAEAGFGESLEKLEKLGLVDQDSYFRYVLSPAYVRKKPNAKASAQRVDDKVLATQKPLNKTDLKMFISGNEKEYKGGTAFCPIDRVSKGKEMIGWHKVYISKAYGGGMAFPHMVIGTPFYGEPNTVCNQSYLVIGPLKDKNEADNLISYIKTKLFRFLVLQKKNAQDAMRGVYQFVLLQDFSHPWTDEMLYKKYDLDKDEIAFIESMIRPMD